jgi:pyridoxamine 5'-phosphate oxidase
MDSRSVEKMRREYLYQPLDRQDLLPDPIEQFRQWLDAATRSTPADWLETNAATLATSDATGRVSARIVLLKGFDSGGFRFFTNYQSAKAQQMAENPHAAMVFYWPHVARQVRIEGTIEKLDGGISELYFHQRPRESQLAALVSPQSQPISGREELQAQMERARSQFGENPIPLPAHWGGYRLCPEQMEFWQGRENRLHDRFGYRREHESSWSIHRLAP